MTNQLPDLEFFTLSETARKLGVSVDTLRRWEKKGKINGIRTEGGHRRFSLEEIENFRYKKIREKIRPITYDSPAPSPVISPITPPVIAPQVQLVSKYDEVYQKPPFNIFRYLKFIYILFLFLVLFFFAKLGVPTKLISYLPEDIKTRVADTRGFFEQKLSFLKLAETPESSSYIKNYNSGAVLAESASKDLSFDVNIDSRFRGNLGIDGSATISGTLTVQGIQTKGNITGQSITSTGAITGTTGVFTGNITVPGIVTNATTFNLLNTNATTLNLGGAATTISLGATSGTTTVNNDLKVSGALTSSGKITASGALSVSGATTLSSTLAVSGATTLSSSLAVTGNLSKINGVSYTWPTTQGAANTSLIDDGAGTLSWGAPSTNVSSATGVLAIANGGTNNSTAYTAGSVIFSDGTKLTQNNTYFFWDDTAHQLKIGSGGAVIPSVNLGADLGTSSLRWNNIYVGTVNSNSTISTTGQALFTYTPTDTTYGQSSVQINPTTAPANSFLLGLGIAGAQRAGIDAEGDLTLGYSGGAGTSAPNNANPLAIYNHSTTNVFNVGTTGNVLASGVFEGISGTNTRLQASGTGTGSTGTGSIYFLDSSGTTRGRFDTTTPLSYLGSGADGAVTISAATNINTTVIAGGRVTYADGIAYRVIAPVIGATTVTRFLGSVTLSNGIAAGDELLIINLQGTSGDSADVGKYEFVKVQSVAADTITFTTALTNNYTGTTASNQKVVVQRVPNYTTVTLSSSGSLTASAWEGLTTTPAGGVGYLTGIVAFRATGAVYLPAGTSISTNTLGFRGGTGGSTTAVGGNNGESYDGSVGRGGNGLSAGETNGGGRGAGGGGTTSPNNGAVRTGGGGGGSAGNDCGGGGGGGGGGNGGGGGGGGGAGAGGGGGCGGTTPTSGATGGNGSGTNINAGGGGGGGLGSSTNGGAGGSGTAGATTTGVGGQVGNGTTSASGAGEGGAWTNGSGGGGGGGISSSTTGVLNRIF